MVLYYLWLQNRNTKVTYSNVNTAFALTGALGAVAAWVAVKADLKDWMPWMVYVGFAFLGAYTAFRLLKVKKDNDLVMNAAYGAPQKMAKDERNLWRLVRGVILLCLLAFAFYGIIFPQACDSDAIYLSCQIKWTIGDIIGVPLFALGCTVMAGLHKGLGNLMSPEGSTGLNSLLFIELLAGIALIYLF